MAARCFAGHAGGGVRNTRGWWLRFTVLTRSPRLRVLLGAWANAAMGSMMQLRRLGSEFIRVHVNDDAAESRTTGWPH